jgi:hypothetical protein
LLTAWVSLTYQPYFLRLKLKKRITIHDIKQALLDERFRSSLPEELSTDIANFLKNPSCSCNHPIYLNVLKKATKQLSEYFPSKEEPSLPDFEKEIEQLSKNNWEVINCSVSELGDKLKDLGPGRKQLEIARWQDQVTVVINHLDGIF